MAYLEELLPEFRKGAKIRESTWKTNHYIMLRDTWFVDENNKKTDITVPEMIADDWELYQEPIDWDYIIKNKCLCWFYDADESNKRAGILKIISENINVLYWNNYDQQWFNCRPVRRDEVTFYEDKKDE